MPSRRHFGRVSYRLLPPRSSLYGAMQTIIGHELRARYELPQDTPLEIVRLLTKLDGPDDFAAAESEEEPDSEGNESAGRPRCSRL